MPGNTKLEIMYYTSPGSPSTTLTSGPSICFTFRPSHQDMRPASIATPHPKPMKVPVAHDWSCLLAPFTKSGPTPWFAYK